MTTLFQILFTYLNVYAISMFTLLPVQKWTLKRKLLYNIALAAVITLGVHLLLKSGVIPLRKALQ